VDQSSFYGVVSAINFTLLGLWWVAVKDRAERIGETESSRRVAYLVSLQFVIPGTVSLLAQVAPDTPMVWRSSFAVAGLVGAVGIALLARDIRATTAAKVAPALFLVIGVPIYLLVIAVALFPEGFTGGGFRPIQAEATLVTLLVFLGVQEAWVVSMTPPKSSAATRAVE